MFNKLKLKWAIHKKAKELVKEEMEYRYNLKKLSEADITRDLLQAMIDRANAKQIKIEYTNETTGEHIVISPVTNSEIAYESFKEKWQKNRQNVRQI